MTEAEYKIAITNKIIKTLEVIEKPVNPSVLLQKNGWNKAETIERICKVFKVKTFNGVLESIPQIEVAKDEKNTPSVSLKKQTIKTTITAKPSDSSISERMKKLLEYLKQGLYGKEEAVRLALLSAVANESIFFMGPPGTAKSMISRRIAAAFNQFYKDELFNTEGGGYFEYLMNEFSTPDEICGPVDLNALNEKPSRYERLTAGYLPTSQVAFLDEIWKSGPAILNTLLTIINEKKYHNGNKVEKVPLISLAAASNELPPEDGSLEALWDRFILRVFVNPVTDKDDFFNVVDDENEKKTEKEKFEQQKNLYKQYSKYLLKTEEVKAWEEKINKVELGDTIKNVIQAIRQELKALNEQENRKESDYYYVSDRRWKKIVHILKTCAFLNGRDSVDLMDCSLIEYAIWKNESQHNEVSDIIKKILNQNGIGASAVIADIKTKKDEFKKNAEERWFEDVLDPPEDKIVKIDGNECYECTRNPGEIFYITKEETYSYRHQHTVYDSSKQKLCEDDFRRDDDRIFCRQWYTVNKNSPKTHKEPKVFASDAKKALIKAFDKYEYNPIVKQIEEEISYLQNFKTENEKEYASNIFAKVEEYKVPLFETIDKALITLENDRCQLQKLRDEKYAGIDYIIYDFKPGYIIMNDGSCKKSLPANNRNEILARVCIMDDAKSEVYIISYEGWGDIDFDEAKKIASSFRKKDADFYNDNWRLPTIEEWQKIYKNRSKLKHMSHPFSGRYWSSSVTEKGAVYCFDFDSGKDDFTTPDHPYNVFLIRKLELL